MNTIDKFWQAGLIDKPEDFTEYHWTIDTDSGCISWNGENNLEDLFNGDGETYSECILEEPQEVDGDVILTIGGSCGGSGQVIFSLSKKVENPYE